MSSACGGLEGLRIIASRYRFDFRDRVALWGLVCPRSFAFRIARGFRSAFLEAVLFFSCFRTRFSLDYNCRFSEGSPFAHRAVHPEEGRTLDPRVAALAAHTGGFSFRFRFLSGWNDN